MVRDMITTYQTSSSYGYGGGDTSFSSQDDSNNAKIDKIQIDFNNFHTGQGVWAGKFNFSFTPSSSSSLPSSSSLSSSSFPSSSSSLHHRITFMNLKKWIIDTGGHDARLSWFMVNGKNSLFYQEIALPILSIGSLGSISMNEITKPLLLSSYCLSPPPCSSKTTSTILHHHQTTTKNIISNNNEKSINKQKKKEGDNKSHNTEENESMGNSKMKRSDKRSQKEEMIRTGLNLRFMINSKHM